MSGFLRSLRRSIFFYTEAEAAYFVSCNGNRTWWIWITANIIKCHPKVLEPLFHEFEATVEVHPIMVLMILRGLFTIQIRSK